MPLYDHYPGMTYAQPSGRDGQVDERHGIGVISAEGQCRDDLVLRCAVVSKGLATGERVLSSL